LQALPDLKPRTPVSKRVGRAVTPNEAADVLAVLYPALLRFADKQLRSRHLDHQQAEDLVQEAAVSWFASGTKLDASARINTYLRTAICHRAENMRLRRSDALDQNPLSLDAQIEED
jgi:DNA-directed RNA polymerase specialized sigma24 family protein